MTITSRVEPKYLCFWPFMGHSRIITRLWCHKYKLLLPDSSKNSTFILKNLANNSIFDSGSSNSGSIHQIYDLTLPRLKTRPLRNSPQRQNSSWDPALPKFVVYLSDSIFLSVKSRLLCVSIYTLSKGVYSYMITPVKTICTCLLEHIILLVHNVHELWSPLKKYYLS